MARKARVGSSRNDRGWRARTSFRRRSLRPPKGSSRNGRFARAISIAMALTVKSRRARSSSIDPARTRGSAAGFSYSSARAVARSRRSPSGRASTAVPKRPWKRAVAGSSDASRRAKSSASPSTTRSTSLTGRRNRRSRTAPPTRYRAIPLARASRRASATLRPTSGGSAPGSAVTSLEEEADGVLTRERAHFPGQPRRRRHPDRVSRLQLHLEVARPNQTQRERCRARVELQELLQPTHERLVGERQVDADLHFAGEPLPNPLERREVLDRQFERATGLPNEGGHEDRQIGTDPGGNSLVEVGEDADRHSAGRVLEGRLQHRLAFVDALLDLLLLDVHQNSSDPHRLIDPLREVLDAGLGEPVDLFQVLREGMPRDVEPENVLFPAQFLLERPLRLLPQLVGESLSIFPAAGEEIRLTQLRLLPTARRHCDDRLRSGGERRAVPAERVERSRADQGVQGA